MDKLHKLKLLFLSLCLVTGLVSSAAAARLSSAELRSQRSSLFSKEQARQRALYPRTEKIEVTLQGPGLQGSLLVMNKGVSTPHSCTHREYLWLHANVPDLWLLKDTSPKNEI